MKKAVIVLSLLCIFFIGFLPVKDPDFGWHYRCGNQFLTTGRLCLTNNYSYYLSNYKAYNPSFLYDITLAFLYNHGGFLSVSIAGSLIIALCGLLFFLLIRPSVWISIPVFAAIFFLSYRVFDLGLRSQIFTYLFFLLVWWVLNQKRKIFYYCLPILFMIWANAHVGFFVGLAVLLFYAFEKKAVSFKSYVIIILSSFAATLVNPFGLNVYLEILRHAYAPLNTMIAEWLPPPLWETAIIVFLGFIGTVIIARKRPFAFLHLLLLIFFGLLASKAVRNMPFFYTVFFYILLQKIKFNSEQFFSISLPILIPIVFLTLIIYVPKTLQFDTDWHTYCYEGTINPYPCAAIQKFSALNGNVFANYEWGGFLIWQRPRIKVFVDGRMPAWKADDGSYPYQAYLSIIQTKPGWNEKLRQLKTDYLLIGTGTYLDLLLQPDAVQYGWEEKYRDDVSVMYQAL